MKPTSSPPAAPNGLLGPLLILAGVLALFFWRSLQPGYVHFSNDNPVGTIIAEWQQLPGAMVGKWADLNDTGSSAGTDALDVTGLVRWFLGPIGYAKFFPVATLLILGLGAWSFFRQLKLTPLAAMLGALAAMLSSNLFGSACWGVGSQEIGIGMDFAALALAVSDDLGRGSRLREAARWMLAGMCVGINIMEAADIGAYFSLFIAAFIIFRTFVRGTGAPVMRLAQGALKVAVVAGFAAFIASQAIVSLLSTEINGVAGQEVGHEDNQEHWDWATQWSLPKSETFSLIVPGLFGYKMDTPNNMPEFESAYQGGCYWGGMGRSPEIDRFIDSHPDEQPPQGLMRFTGSQNYVGLTVALLAAWAIAQSFRRREQSNFTPAQQREVWFWAGVLVFTLVLAWGRFDPFGLYAHTFYKLPYFSSTRNPTKFLLIFSWAISILFALGVDDLGRRYLNPAGTPGTLSAWWARAAAFERKWAFASAGLLGASLVGWLIYSSEKPALMNWLEKTGYPDPQLSGIIADFSISQVLIFALLVAAAAGLVLLIIAGVFAGPRARLGGMILGALLVLDLGRADLPYINHWNYVDKYELGTLNPVVKFLADRPYEHRVKLLPFRPAEGMNDFTGLYNIEWVQQLFPFYNIQSLDIVQRPRVPADVAAYEGALAPRSPDTYYLLRRQWELTDTRYLLGAVGTSLGSQTVDTLSFLNGALDPEQKRFRTVQRFEIIRKPGVAQATQYSDLTIATNDTGPYALFEFTGALPRAKLYTDWQVNTNSEALLKTLTSPGFDPAQTVLLAKAPAGIKPAPGATAGTVAYVKYHSRHLELDVQATTDAVLLLNDTYDPNWRVTLDGQPTTLLRANYLMRGLAVPAGHHTVVMNFEFPHLPLNITMVAFALGVGLCGFLAITGRQTVKPSPID